MDRRKEVDKMPPEDFGSGWAGQRLLPSIIFSEEEKRDALVADLVCRQYGLVKLFGESSRTFIGNLLEKLDDPYQPLLLGKYGEIKDLPLEELKRLANEHKKKSVLIFALHLTGACQMNCGICYTARAKRPDELTWPEIEKLLKNAKELGTKTVYVAGEGEPLLDTSFLKIAQWCRENGLCFHVFTNGLALSRMDEAEKFCMLNDLDPEQLKAKHSEGDIRVALTKELADYPIYFYCKLWSTDPAVHREMTGIQEPQDHEWIDYPLGERSVRIPYGLKLLIENWPLERVGVQTTPTRLNWEDVRNTIIPLIERYSLRSYLEPLIHSGKNEGNRELDLAGWQDELFTPYYVRQNCIRVRWKQVVSSTGICLPALSINYDDLARGLGFTTPDMLKAFKRALSVRKEGGGMNDLFEMRFAHPLLAKPLAQLAYSRGCICETFFQDREVQGSIQLVINREATLEYLAQLRRRREAQGRGFAEIERPRSIRLNKPRG